MRTLPSLVVASLLAAGCLGSPLDASEWSASGEEAPAEPTAGPSRVYFFDGFFVHLEVASLTTALDQIQAHLDANHPGTHFARWHNSLWRSVCNEVRSLPAAERPAHLVFVGHSYGVGAAMDVSRCLSDRTVDLVVSIDSVQRIQTPDQSIVPDNVLVSPNFFEAQGILQGSRDNHRADGSYTGITNTLIEVPPSLSPHYRIVNELVDTGVLQGLLDQTL